MTGRERLARFRASLAAAGVGWAAAMAATLPIALYKVWTEGVWTEEAWTNSVGGWRPVLWSLGAGAAIWCAWSLAILFGAWLLGALPAIALVREEWLLRRKRRAVLLSAAAAEVVVLVKFHFWMWFKPDHYVDAPLLTLYSLLLGVFATAAAAFYLRSIGRRRLAAMSNSIPSSV